MEPDKALFTEEYPGIPEFAPAFSNWLHEVDQARFDYVAVITRRASNTMEWLLRREKMPGLAQSYITDNALLAKAEEVSKHYITYGNFPKIAILDDVLAHGRNLNSFLENLKELLFACLKRVHCSVGQEKLESDYYKCLTLWVYVINDMPFFLKQEYQWRLRYQNIWPESKWRRLSGSIAESIWKKDVANTSYVLSAFVEKDDLGGFVSVADHPNWILDTHTAYRGDAQEFYMLRDAYEYGVYPTVRSYEKEGYRYYTPYFFVEMLRPNQAVAALRKMIAYMLREADEPTKRLARLFNTIGEYPQRLSVYCQLFYLFFSQITLSVFLQDHFLTDSSAFDYDLDKIARNYGSAGNIKPMLKALTDVRWKKEQLLEFIQALELQEGYHAVSSDLSGRSAIRSTHDVVSALELKVYKQALEHEERANALKNNDVVDSEYSLKGSSNSTGEKPVEGFLNELREELGVSAADISATASLLSGLTQMMDRGDVALKARAERDGSGKMFFYSAVRNTELSLSIMPRRLNGCYSEFFQIAQFYWRDDTFPKRVRLYFEDRVFRYDHRLEAKRYIDDAEEFAKLICEHRAIVDSMLNWRSVYKD